MGQFVQDSLTADEFMKQFMDRWSRDRDAQWEQVNAGRVTSLAERELSEVLDQVFTACDCYTPTPANLFDISAEEFKREVLELYCGRWHDGDA